MYATLLVTRCPITPISISSLPTRLSFAATLALSDPSQPPKLRPRSISTFPRRLFATPYRIRVDEAHEDTTESFPRRLFATPYRIRVDEAHEDTTFMG